MSNFYKALYSKIENREAKIGVIGLGYVGLPLVVEFANAGYHVLGLDIDEKKVADLNKGISHIIDVKSRKVEDILKSGYFKASTKSEELGKVDIVVICVPTPLTSSYEPDLSYVNAAVSQVKTYIKPGTMIILESTTYPGTTEEVIGASLAEGGFIVGEDYFLCYSPERVDPGNKYYTTKNTPKVLGGTTKNCKNMGRILYQSIVENVVVVSSPKVAEMSKLLENTFRSINIAFINEMSLLCDKIGVDIWETIDAASSKPFGFMKFNPGPGIGGHCIPLDPMYLSWKAKESNFFSRFIELAQEINQTMPQNVVNKISSALNLYEKPIKKSKILLLGMAYKEDIDDLRESPGLHIYELLKQNGATVEYIDPLVSYFYDKNGYKVSSTPLEYKNLNTYDCVVMITKHSNFDMDDVVQNSNLIVDTRNAFSKYNNEKIIKIGCPIHQITLA
ncbi:nucleotide sugar dehydrogenase [Bacillus cereus]|uniref:nucleotide sugar dehydrogenase n=1 Tax=Bacillus cereus TaxID=1396 RepID=UPI000279D175|nr:nucleotide sugar dehydrogenase [Bacillus cereus]EJR93390.1 nucleotide sugar dehydrogenase [Bacillus cereus VD200]